MPRLSVSKYSCALRRVIGRKNPMVPPCRMASLNKANNSSVPSGVKSDACNKRRRGRTAGIRGLLGLWFGFCLLLSFAVGYVARHTLTTAADGLTVMRVTGAIAFIGYGMSSIIDSIWHGVPWSNTGRALIDAAIYAVVTGLAFRILWPS